MRQPSLSCAVLLLVALLGLPQVARGYSVLAHEAMIDAAWDAQLGPALRRRFPAATALQIREARAFAYGGSLIHDVGYYPFGNRLFSDLVHYVRSGDFIEALLRESRDVEEFAFALGALAHYASDTVGHAVAVNRVVPMVYPKLAATHGQEILYAASPSRHVMVEFAFDVLQVGRGNFRSDVYQELLGFDVAMAPLERAFQATYGLQLADLFGDTELAVGSFRRAASRLIPEINDHYATPDSQAPAGQSARQRRKLHTRLEAMNAAR